MSKKIKERALKFIGVAVLSLSIILFSSSVNIFKINNAIAAKCCSYIAISNFGDLINLVIKHVTSAIISTITSEISKHKDFLLTQSKEPGALQDWEISSMQEALDNTHAREYNNLVENIQYKSFDSTKWVEDVKKNSNNVIVPPVVSPVATTNGPISERFSDYGAFVQGDLSVVYSAFRTIDASQVDRLTLDRIKMKIRELESSKVALSQEVAEIGATAKKFEMLSREIQQQLKKIDEAQKSGNYKTEQAVKDLLKIQMLQTQFLLEQLRGQLNQEAVMIAQYNQKLAEERNKILNDLIAAQTKVKGTFRVK